MENTSEGGTRSRRNKMIVDRNANLDGDSGTSSVKSVTISLGDLRPNDIIFGVSGSESNETYVKILTGWWEVYEFSGHVDKRNVADAAVKEMLASGLRFVVPLKKYRPPEFALLPEDSRKIRDKVMRKLRKLIEDNTSHLTEQEADERKTRIKAHRRRANKLGVAGITKERTPNGMFNTWESIWESGKNGDEDDLERDLATQPSSDSKGSDQDLVALRSGNTGTASNATLVVASDDKSSQVPGNGAPQDNLARLQAESEHLDLSHVFEDEAPEETNSNNSFTLVCPQGTDRSNRGPIRSERMQVDLDRRIFRGPEQALWNTFVTGHAHRAQNHWQNEFIAIVHGGPTLGVEAAMPIAYEGGDEEVSHHRVGENEDRESGDREAAAS